MMTKTELGVLLFSATLGYAGMAHADLRSMGDAELSAVHGQLAILPGLVNVGPLFNLPLTAFNLFGATSLLSGVNIGALSGGTMLNIGGVTGVSITNTLGLSLFSGFSLPLGITGVSVVSTPWSINGLSGLNVF
ncbi:hypothetical protein [Candidatus Macondimonas diazotrophica]|uniref:Uncharacterized protein n=1 Tax=Candidatus Macondimonas diazotrophica TaxID=2305248 RepID=A0A4Z0F8X4_9GAMM|nr:hypothetical protein [Candidatus Macondimonas diazotrophica]NCU01658.1 hypothetical protein [Candidatus Macondimonas diazotrophica]TFZ81754.1 hypothetical protein E4680_11310 [Candidatus Macondimonas diazotrophica]HBG31839.1 hypothetical protein [Gammaproteobacteria bacterium]HBG50592.1 hypothetical protein [Gammaproteobacteria bacterium]